MKRRRATFPALSLLAEMLRPKLKTWAQWQVVCKDWCAQSSALMSYLRIKWEKSAVPHVLTNVRHLDIRLNGLYRFQDWERFTSLTHLSICNPIYMPFVFPQVSRFIHLTSLDLNQCQQDTLDALSNLPSLRHLSLGFHIGTKYVSPRLWNCAPSSLSLSHWPANIAPWFDLQHVVTLTLQDLIVDCVSHILKLCPLTLDLTLDNIARFRDDVPYEFMLKALNVRIRALTLKNFFCGKLHDLSSLMHLTQLRSLTLLEVRVKFMLEVPIQVKTLRMRETESDVVSLGDFNIDTWRVVPNRFEYDSWSALEPILKGSANAVTRTLELYMGLTSSHVRDLLRWYPNLTRLEVPRCFVRDYPKFPRLQVVKIKSLS